MTRRLRRFVNALGVAAVLLIVAVSCSSSGHPTSYDDQIDEDTGLSNVEMNWLEGCEVGFSEELAQDANDICSCSYSRIKSEIPFEAFVEVNDRLSSDPTSLQDRAAVSGSTESAIVQIVAACIAEA